MFRRHLATALAPKANATAALISAAGKGGAGTSQKLQTDEKLALAGLEYLYEANLANDGNNKRAADVAKERRVSEAYDRYMHVIDSEFDRRVDRLVARMNEALDALPDEYLEEATLLNSEAPPLSFRLPKQSPPIPGFEPALGFDVPQLRVVQADEKPIPRATDTMQLAATMEVMDELDQFAANAGRGMASSTGEGGGSATGEEGQQQQDEGPTVTNTYPFVDSSRVRELLTSSQAKLDELHGEMRSTVPLTGTSGEEWEAHCALQRRAFARQQLILDLAEKPELRERFDADEAFAAAERARRGILPLEEESPPSGFDIVAAAEGKEQQRIMPLPVAPMHVAQFPKYHQFRES
jgi:hypothetical protein